MTSWPTRSRLVCLLAFLLFAPFAWAGVEGVEDGCPRTSSDRQWASACFEQTKSGRKIKSSYLHQVVFERRAFAVIVIESPAELVVLNRRGTVIKTRQSHLREFQFEPGDGDISRFGYVQESAETGRRFRCGYYQRERSNIVIAPIYDACAPFHGDTAAVCLGCSDYCPGDDCHENQFLGGEGLQINRKNEILRRFPLPLLPRCRGPAQGPSERECRPNDSDDPFSRLK